MFIKTVISAVLLLSATTLPALAEDTAGSPARPYPLPQQRALFGGAVADLSGSGAGTVATAKAASNEANALMETDASNVSSAPVFSTDPPMYDYLSGATYRGGY